MVSVSRSRVKWADEFHEDYIKRDNAVSMTTPEISAE